MHAPNPSYTNVMIEKRSSLDGDICVLPKELITEIFEHAIWEDTHSLEHERYLRRYVTPLTLGAVCSSWRSFVWDTPSLWTIVIMLLPYSRYRTKISLLELWLKNSKSCTLDIWFDVNEELYHDAKRWWYITPVLQKLVDHSSRWRKFNSIISAELIDVLSEVQGKVPLLQAGYLQWIEDTTPTLNGSNPNLKMFKDAPLLKRFILAGRSDLLKPNCVSLPWSQLISVCGYLDKDRKWDSVLSKCTSMEECKISLGGRSELLHKDVTIHFPCLRSLHVTVWQEGSIATFLNRIRCPQLRRLHLSSRQYEILPSQQLEEFIDRSGCTLEYLNLTNLSKVSSVISVFEKLSTLKCLILQATITEDDSTACWCFDSVLDKLDLTANSTKLLPNLEQLQCDVFADYSAPRSTPALINPRKLLKPLQQRWNPPEGVSKLKVVTMGGILSFGYPRDREVFDGLKELKREGMVITATDV